MRLSAPISALLLCAAATVAALASPDAALADYDCADFGSQAEAQEHLLPGDPYRLDADDDGIACESNPCPCSTSAGSTGEGGSPPPPPPPPYELSKSAARAEAKRVARRFVRRSPRVDSLKFETCHRLAMRRVDCAFVARGSTAETRTACRLRVAVRARDRRPAGRLSASRCRTAARRALAPADALRALRARGAELAGKMVGIFNLERISRTSFRGRAEWTRREAALREECFALMEAELGRDGLLRVTVIDSGCEPL